MSWTTAQPPIFVGEDERELKLQFAALLVAHSGNANEAAYALFKGKENYGRAWAAAEHWPSDPIVALEVERLKEDGDVGEFLPSKEQFAKAMFDRGNQSRDDKVALGYYELFAKVLDYLPRNGQGDVNVNLIQNVIEVPPRAREDELDALEGQWTEQQRKLVADARSSRPN